VRAFKDPLNTRPIRLLIAAAILVGGSVYLTLIFSSAEAVRRDFISYWAAGQLLRSHENPYGSRETLRVERLAGFPGAEPLIQRMPPLALPLFLPLGYVSPRSGVIVWSIVTIGLFVFALQSSRQLANGSASRMHLLSYVFAPALACILAGQFGVILLAGLVGFLRFHASRPFVAGICLALLTVKPHLFLAFAVSLIVWIAVNRRYALLCGGLSGLAALSLASAGIAPQAWPQYLAMIRAARLDQEALPNASLLFRLAIEPAAVWLQGLPALAVFLWGLWYALRHARQWDWMKHGSLVLLLSVLAAPYSWFTDEAILLPAMLHALYLAELRGRSLIWYMAPAGLATVLVLAGIPLYSMCYVWTPAAWLACWLQLERVPSRETSAAGAAARAESI
jgi:hypothetical protein